MQAKYDTEQIELTPRFIVALVEVLEAEAEMLRIHDPEYADCWIWGRCFVGDLAYAKGLQFEFGGVADLPDDGLGAFAVVEQRDE